MNITIFSTWPFETCVSYRRFIFKCLQIFKAEVRWFQTVAHYFLSNILPLLIEKYTKIIEKLPNYSHDSLSFKTFTSINERSFFTEDEFLGKAESPATEDTRTTAKNNKKLFILFWVKRRAWLNLSNRLDWNTQTFGWCSCFYSVSLFTWAQLSRLIEIPNVYLAWIKRNLQSKSKKIFVWFEYWIHLGLNLLNQKFTFENELS